MNRRNFVAAIGLGTLEAMVLHRIFLPAATAEAAVDPTVNDPVRFKRFGGKSNAVLIRSRKFRNFIEAQFPGVVAPFHSNLPLWAAVWTWTSNPGVVTTEHHRYVVAKGCMAHFAPCRGMLWLDAKGNEPSPLVVLAFMNVVGPRRELWIVCNQNLVDRPSWELPHHLTMTISRWLRERRPKMSDGGLLTHLIIYDRSFDKVAPSPAAWGIKPYRCEPSMSAESL